MIPERIEQYLKQHHPACEHMAHARAVQAQRVAAVEHVSGARMAKTVVVDMDGEEVIAVVAADRKVDLAVLARISGAGTVELVPEDDFAPRFTPCEAGAEPPLGLFGMRIYVDAALAHEPWIVMRGGTHEDALRMRTEEWLEEEGVQVVEGLATDDAGGWESWRM